MANYYVGCMMVGSDAIYHHGIKGMHWGIRRFQNADGSLTAAGRARYDVGEARGSSGDSEARRAKTKKYVKRGLAIAGALAAVGVGVAIAKNPQVVKRGMAAATKILNGAKDKAVSVATEAAKRGGELYRQGAKAVTGVATEAAKRGGELYRQGAKAVTGAATEAAKRGGELYRQGAKAVGDAATEAARRGGELYRQGTKAASDFQRGLSSGARAPGLDASKLGSKFRPSGATLAGRSVFTSASKAQQSLASLMREAGNSAKSAQSTISAFLGRAAQQGESAYKNALAAVNKFAEDTARSGGEAYRSARAGAQRALAPLTGTNNRNRGYSGRITNSLSPNGLRNSSGGIRNAWSTYKGQKRTAPGMTSWFGVGNNAHGPSPYLAPMPEYWQWAYMDKNKKHRYW